MLLPHSNMTHVSTPKSDKRQQKVFIEQDSFQNVMLFLKIIFYLNTPEVVALKNDFFFNGDYFFSLTPSQVCEQ